MRVCIARDCSHDQALHNYSEVYKISSTFYSTTFSIPGFTEDDGK